MKRLFTTLLILMIAVLSLNAFAESADFAFSMAVDSAGETVAEKESKYANCTVCLDTDALTITMNFADSAEVYSITSTEDVGGGTAILIRTTREDGISWNFLLGDTGDSITLAWPEGEAYIWFVKKDALETGN